MVISMQILIVDKLCDVFFNFLLSCLKIPLNFAKNPKFYIRKFISRRKMLIGAEFAL